jgi:DNA invertase Pin-like site-specific DNA recombinase
MPTYGYARVSTEGQDLEPQIAALRAAGCSEIIEEKASGTDRTRPELAQLLGRLRRGDTLVVVRINRLARSLAHLLAMLDRLQAVGAHFRSLSDPIDTANPTGRLVIQVIGAIAEFERNLIAERTKAGLAVAKARGRKLGNPGLQAGNPEARSRLVAGQKRAHLAALLAGLDTWLPTVRRLRPAACWEAVTDAVNQLLRQRPAALPATVLRAAFAVLWPRVLRNPAYSLPPPSGSRSAARRAGPPSTPWCATCATTAARPANAASPPQATGRRPWRR